MREMAINDDEEVKRVMEAVRLLKHIAFQSHNWNAANAGPSIAVPDPKPYTLQPKPKSQS
jgi:hypothetical protein